MSVICKSEPDAEPVAKPQPPQTFRSVPRCKFEYNEKKMFLIIKFNDYFFYFLKELLHTL